MNKKYKLALGLGTVATVVAPIATVVACGDNKNKEVTKPITPETKTPGTQTPVVTTPVVTTQTNTGTQTPVVTTPVVTTPTNTGTQTPVVTTPVVTTPIVTIINVEEFMGKVLPSTYVISSDITEIKERAFALATLPIGFAIPATVTTIGSDAFAMAKIPSGYMWDKKVNGHPIAGSRIVPFMPLSSSDVSISRGQYEGVVIPNTFTIPASVETLEELAFYDATLPTNFEIPLTIKHWHEAFDGAIIPEGFMWGNLNAYGFAIPGSRVVPFVPLADGITTIAKGQFRNAVLPTNFVIPNSVLTIEEGAFANSTFTSSFVIPEGVTTIQQSAFGGEIGRQELAALPTTVTLIGSEAFYNTKLLHGLTIPVNCVLGQDAFRDAIIEDGYKWSSVDVNGNPLPGATIVAQ